MLFAHALNSFDCVVLYANFLQGKLYLYEAPQPGAKLAATESVWADRRVIRVPPDKIGGAEHVIALCPGVCKIAHACVFAWLRFRSMAQPAPPTRQRPSPISHGLIAMPTTVGAVGKVTPALRQQIPNLLIMRHAFLLLQRAWT